MRSPQTKIRSEQDARAAVVQILGQQKAQVWWHTRNPNFGGFSPQYLVKMGREQNLYRWIESKLQGY